MDCVVDVALPKTCVCPYKLFIRIATLYTIYYGQKVDRIETLRSLIFSGAAEAALGTTCVFATLETVALSATFLDASTEGLSTSGHGEY